MYRHLVEARGGKIRTAVAKHENVPIINGANNIDRFQIMELVGGEITYSAAIYGAGGHEYVQDWFGKG